MFITTKERTCLLDISHKDTEVIPIEPAVHNWQPALTETAASCTVNGKVDQICSYNSEHTKTDTIPSLGHNPGNWLQTTAPTCTTNGIETGTCTRTGCNEPNTPRKGQNALGHNWKGWEINIGSISKKTCSRCIEKINGEIGDTGSGGGKIFYRTNTGFIMTDNGSRAYYLEAARSDLTSQTINGGLRWGYDGNFTVGNHPYPVLTGTAIGTGRKNNALIIEIDPNPAAARACYNSGSGWFLPSRDELNQLFVNRTIVGNLSTTFSYWSSSCSSTNGQSISAWSQNFRTGIQESTRKNQAIMVRAIRAF